jgi:hypothetical protein
VFGVVFSSCCLKPPFVSKSRLESHPGDSKESNFGDSFAHWDESFERSSGDGNVVIEGENERSKGLFGTSSSPNTSLPKYVKPLASIEILLFIGNFSFFLKIYLRCFLFRDVH